MTLKLGGQFETYNDPRGNPLISLNRDGTLFTWGIDFADGSSQKAASSSSFPATKVLYVDNGRSDVYPATGSIATPFKTIAGAVNQIIINGDSQTNPYAVVVNAGTYNETVTLSDPSLGTLIFFGYGTGQSGNTAATISGISAISATNLAVTFQGFTITGSVSFSGMSNGTATLQSCWFENSAPHTISACPGVVQYLSCFGFWELAVTSSEVWLVSSDFRTADAQSFDGTSKVLIQVGSRFDGSITIPSGCIVDVLKGSKVGGAIEVQSGGTLFVENSSLTSVVVDSGGMFTAEAAWVGSYTGTPAPTGTLLAGAVTLANNQQILTGTNSPLNAVSAPVGSLYLRTDGGANTTLYVKESGTGNTGWVAK